MIQPGIPRKLVATCVAVGTMFFAAVAGCDDGSGVTGRRVLPGNTGSKAPDTSASGSVEGTPKPTRSPSANPSTAPSTAASTSPSTAPSAAGSGSPSPTPTASASQDPGPTPTPTPTSGASPTPTPGTTPSPTPVPTPTPRPAMMLTISPADNLDVYLPSAQGAARPAGYPTQLQFTATVFHDDDSQTSFATWTSDQPAIASVSSSGLVKAVAAGTGKGPWTVTIKAESFDKKASAQREVVVHAVGDIDLTVE